MFIVIIRKVSDKDIYQKCALLLLNISLRHKNIGKYRKRQHYTFFTKVNIHLLDRNGLKLLYLFKFGCDLS